MLVAAGVLVGALVATVSVMTAAPFCPGGLSGEECRGLVATLAGRAGAVAGVATVVMVLLAAGLIKMMTQQDRDRADRAMEAYLASRERPSEQEA